MTVDYRKTFKYLIEHLEDCNLGHRDKEKLMKIICNLKVRVQYLLAGEQALGTELKGEVEKAIRVLESRIKTLEDEISNNKGRLDDYKDGIPEGVTFGVYNLAKTGYEGSRKPAIEDRIANLENEKGRLERLKSSLNDPKKFAEELFEADLGHSYDVGIQSMLDSCASNMIYSGDVNNYDYYRDGKFFNIEGIGSQRIFSTDKYAYNFTANPEAMATFFEIIMNPELYKELEEYRLLSEKLDKAHQDFESPKENADLACEFLEKVSSNSPECQDIEGFIKEYAQLIEDEMMAREELEKYQTQYPALCSQNLLKKILNKIFGRTKNKKELEERVKKAEGAVYKKIKDSYSIIDSDDFKRYLATMNVEEDIYGRKYLDYMQLTHKEYCESHGQSKVFLRKDMDEGKKELRAVYQRYVKCGDKSCAPLEVILADKGADMHHFVLENSSIKFCEASEKQEQAKSVVAECEAAKAEKYDKLTSKAKNLVDAGVKVNPEWRRRYIEFIPSGKECSSPFIASQILPILMRFKEIKTPGDLEELGIALTEQEMSDFISGKVKCKDSIGYKDIIRKAADKIESYTR